MTSESNSIDAEAEADTDTALWRAFLEENLDALLEGVPKRPGGWWKDLPECPVLAMFELFPATKLN